MAVITGYQRLLHLRVLALTNIENLYWYPHVEDVARLYDTPVTKLSLPDNARRINSLAFRYRRLISPELVPRSGYAN